MRSLVLAGRNMLGAFRKDEEGQDAFEYMLVIAVIMLAIVGAAQAGIAPGGLVTQIVTGIGTRITNLLA